MLNENAKKWVAALRSGEYSQGRNVLRWYDRASDDDFFCCLGVACNISGLGLWSDLSEDEKKSYLEATTFLPPEVADWLNLKSDSGSFLAESLPQTIKDEVFNHLQKDDIISLATLNDASCPFETIADIIECEPAGLFNEES